MVLKIFIHTLFVEETNFIFEEGKALSLVDRENIEGKPKKTLAKRSK